MKRHGWLLAGASALALAACSTPQQPAKEVGKAELAVRSAQEEPRSSEAAGAEVRMAQDKLERAKVALHEKNYDKAQRLAEEASVDAELGRVKAQSDDAAQSAAALEAAIQSLQNEAQRGARMQ
ncbi:MAG TPA: DUF4398 domain-containing protein [Myxococcota bacterium]|nr:DUF4398 domain-containing protein [Myxococcota bacterium]